MSAEHAHQTGADSTLAVERAVQSGRAAFKKEPTAEAAAPLVDALMRLAEMRDALGDAAAGGKLLAEAEAIVPRPLPSEEAWHGRVVMLNRFKAGVAQRQDRHADAIDAFETALRTIPFEPGEGGRGVNSVRIQLLVRLARSRLALGRGAEAAADIPQCEIVLRALEGEIPARALAAIRAAVLENHANSLALLGNFAAAEEKFAASLDLIDRTGEPELNELRERVLKAWAGTLRADGRAAEADALLGGSRPAGTCDCAAHRHDAHAHHHHHHVHHHHGEHSACGCGGCSG